MFDAGRPLNGAAFPWFWTSTGAEGFPLESRAGLIRAAPVLVRRQGFIARTPRSSKQRPGKYPPAHLWPDGPCRQAGMTTPR